jgi:hypothetical protein
MKKSEMAVVVHLMLSNLTRDMSLLARIACSESGQTTRIWLPHHCHGLTTPLTAVYSTIDLHMHIVISSTDQLTYFEERISG